MIRATIAKGPTGRALLHVHCRRCGWTAEISPRRLMAAVAHPCTQQLTLKEDR